MTLWKSLRLLKGYSASVNTKTIVKNLLLVSVFTVGIMSILASANLDSVKGTFIKPEVELQLSEEYTSKVDKLNKRALETELNELDQTINNLEIKIAEQQQAIEAIESQKIALIKKMKRGVIRDEKNPETIEYKALSTKRFEQIERLVSYVVDIEEIVLKKEYISSKLTGAAEK
ncbi:MAG: hypothetical protein GQ578_00250 [Desulfuromonadaceae bacterium]|nr:hypothetical protein [Desulfuromonadaceae bacterium]